MEFVIHWHWQFLYVIAASTLLFLPIRIFSKKRLYNLHTYRVFIALSATYWLEHITTIYSLTVRWEYEFLAKVPGLRFFLAVSLITGAVILACAIRYAGSRPLITSLTPMVFLVSWYANVIVLFWRSPKEFVLPDGASSFWLFTGSLITTAFLFVYALGASKRSA